MTKNGLNLMAFSLFYWSCCAAEQPTHFWHSYAYSGYAWSKMAGFLNPDPKVFQLDSQTDDDNVLRNAPFVGIALNYSFLNWLDIGISYDCYAVFAYQKFHSNLFITSQLENLYSQYQRQFSLQHQSAMLDLFLNLPICCHFRQSHVLMRPMIAASVGVGINNMFNFQTIYNNYDVGETIVTTVANNNIAKSFAWRVEGGLKFENTESNIAFGITYRYYNGGQFASGTTYMFTDLANAGAIYENLPAWKGMLKTNQIKLYINVNFD